MKRENIILGLSALAPFLLRGESGGATMLQKVQWVDKNGRVRSIQAKKIGTGTYSTVFLDPIFQEVYTITDYRDMSKIILADIYAQSPNKNLPAVTYLGNALDGSAFVTKMPFYHEIKPNDPLFKTTQFLRNVSQEWRLNHFARHCFEVEQKVGRGGEDWRTNFKASILRNELLRYIRSKAGNQPQIDKVIQALELVDRSINQSDIEQSLDFDTILDGFQHVNFMKDSKGNIVVVDPVFPNRISKCTTFIVDYISSSTGAEWQQMSLDQFLESLE
jgi:hypothetical protein